MVVALVVAHYLCVNMGAIPANALYVRKAQVGVSMAVLHIIAPSAKIHREYASMANANIGVFNVKAQVFASTIGNVPSANFAVLGATTFVGYARSSFPKKRAFALPATQTMSQRWQVFPELVASGLISCKKN